MGSFSQKVRLSGDSLFFAAVKIRTFSNSTGTTNILTSNWREGHMILRTLRSYSSVKFQTNVIYANSNLHGQLPVQHTSISNPSKSVRIRSNSLAICRCLAAVIYFILFCRRSGQHLDRLRSICGSEMLLKMTCMIVTLSANTLCVAHVQCYIARHPLMIIVRLTDCITIACFQSNVSIVITRCRPSFNAVIRFHCLAKTMRNSFYI